MIYWLQEATTAGSQGGGSSWLLSAGIIGATVSLIGLILAQLRHTQTLRQTRELEDKRRLEARELETQRAGEAALHKYFEQMRASLADPERPLHRSTMGDALSTIARAQTLVVLEGLDPDRKRILLQFLYESNLINVDKPIISLLGANLQGAILQGANLQGAYLQGAILQEAYLIGANLQEAYLQGANLRKAILQEAHLQEANLQGADLLDADLEGAYLVGAYLEGAYLIGADLQDAYLVEAYLQEANLRGANLQEADLREANLQGADLLGARNLTQEEINQTHGNNATMLSADLHRPARWSKGGQG